MIVTSVIIAFITISCVNNDSSEETSNEDYIDITSVELVDVFEGEEVFITINFDFRLASKNVGSIWVGFNDNIEHPDSYMVENVIFISEPLEGSSTITISTRPVLYEHPDSYNVYLNLSPNSYSKWAPLAVDTWPIVVNQGDRESHDERTGLCTECNFVECQVFGCPNG